EGQLDEGEAAVGRWNEVFVRWRELIERGVAEREGDAQRAASVAGGCDPGPRAPGSQTPATENEAVGLPPGPAAVIPAGWSLPLPTTSHRPRRSFGVMSSPIDRPQLIRWSGVRAWTPGSSTSWPAAPSPMGD